MVLLHSSPSWAYDFNRAIREKQAAKEAKRWSLSEWLEQKSRNKLMDAWLGYNLPSPYEFFLSVDTSNLDQEVTSNTTTSSDSFRSYRGAFGAFVTMVGLYGEYESSDEELEQWKALFMVRLLGTSDQSTNLTLHYGLMNQNFNDDPTQFQIGGGRFNLYLIKAFALTGQYDHIFQGESETGLRQDGFRYEAGAFIEYGAFRIYGSWYEERLQQSLGTLESERVRKGILFGTRLYF
jgi:hypothetical protein